jgi:2-succinyl-6-hydroxy-2,4-cyclohexadiene-1-carboxylate synthase
MSAVPVVALHGFTGTPRAFTSLDVPVALSPYLAGHGPDPDLSAQSFSDEVGRIAQLIRSRLSGPVHLLGYSMGARVALGLLVDSPELFHSATLLGPNPGLSTEDERQERLGWEARWIDILEQDGLAVFEHRWRSLPLFQSQESLPPHSQEAQRTERMSHTALGLAHAMTVLGLGSMPNLWPALSLVQVPVTVVTGELDEKFSRITDQITSVAPQFSVVRLPGVGHNPLLERPDAISALVSAAFHTSSS